jgi:hypothetical protein
VAEKLGAQMAVRIAWLFHDHKEDAFETGEN